jgi:hypothetical protein
MSGLPESGHDWPIYELAAIFPGKVPAGGQRTSKRCGMVEVRCLAMGAWLGEGRDGAAADRTTAMAGASAALRDPPAKLRRSTLISRVPSHLLLPDLYTTGKGAAALDRRPMLRRGAGTGEGGKARHLCRESRIAAIK